MAIENTADPAVVVKDKDAATSANSSQSSVDKSMSSNRGDEEAVVVPASIDAVDREAGDEEPPASCWQRWLRAFCKIYWGNQFPFHVLIVVCLAKAYPDLGAKYLKPDITATWMAVIIIFFLSGVGLRTDQFSKALQHLRFNITAQSFNFFVVSAIMFGLSRFLSHFNILMPELADGMFIASALPVSINAVIVLTAVAGGDEASSVFQAAVGNVIGIFLSPVLVLLYLGTDGSVPLVKVFLSLTYRVLVPLIVGQLVQLSSKKVQEFCAKHKRKLKKTQESVLVYIVYTIFCKRFSKDSNSAIGHVFVVVIFIFLNMIFLIGVSFMLLRALFRNYPELVVCGVYTCHQKTIALGVPLITSMYSGHPNLSLYTLPILIWHPMQLVVGSLIAPKLTEYIKVERQRIDGEKNPKDDEINGGAVDEESQPTPASVPMESEEQLK
jgi:solute carrier family 10 (sodium/bile acid cotransporter), member 7